MYLLLNKNSHIIAMCQSLHFVKKNKYGLTVLCSRSEAQGITDDMGENVYALSGTQFFENYTDIASIANVEDIPDYVTPRKYSFIDGQFVESEGYEETAENITETVNSNSTDITDNRNGLLETYEVAETNSQELAEVREAVIELYEMIAE